MKGKPLTELCVNGDLTEDREEWQQQLRRHCEEVFSDPDETREVQEKRIEYCKKRREICISRTTEELQRLQLTWCCKPGQRCLTTRSTDQKMQL